MREVGRSERAPKGSNRGKMTANRRVRKDTSQTWVVMVEKQRFGFRGTNSGDRINVIKYESKGSRVQYELRFNVVVCGIEMCERRTSTPNEGECRRTCRGRR